MYAQAQAEAGAAQPEGGAKADKKEDGNVVDAEFEEVKKRQVRRVIGRERFVG